MSRIVPGVSSILSGPGCGNSDRRGGLGLRVTAWSFHLVFLDSGVCGSLLLAAWSEE